MTRRDAAKFLALIEKSDSIHRDLLDAGRVPLSVVLAHPESALSGEEKPASNRPSLWVASKLLTAPAPILPTHQHHQR